MDNDRCDSQIPCEACGSDTLADTISMIKGSRIIAFLRPDAELTGELVGTFILVFFGLGAVHVAVLAGGLVGLGQVAAVWGIAVGVAIYVTCFRQQLHSRSAEIAHVKLRLVTGQDTVTANLIGTDVLPTVGGRLDTSRRVAQLLFNARVHVAPNPLRQIFEASLARVAASYCVTAAVAELRGFVPARPQPTHRFSSVVRQAVATPAEPALPRLRVPF